MGNYIKRENSADPSEKRSYNWATIVYPESAPQNWQDVLLQIGFPCCISPLHDKDLKDDGSLKKPHYHVVFHFPTKKSSDQLKDMISLFGGVGHQRVDSIRGAVQYQVHLNHPDKAQYSQSDIVDLCGFNSHQYFKVKIDDDLAFVKLVNLVEDYNLTCYSQLVRIVIDDFPDLLPAVRRYAYALTQYVKSFAYEISEKNNRIMSARRVVASKSYDLSLSSNMLPSDQQPTLPPDFFDYKGWTPVLENFEDL